MMNITGKFVLIYVCERDIQQPMFFETHEQAFDKMCEQFGNVKSLTAEAVKEDYYNLPNDDVDFDDGYVGENHAFTERFGNNHDWQIYNLEELEG